MGEKMSKPALAGILAAVAIVVGVIGYRFVPKGEAAASSAMSSDPEFAFMVEKAKLCQGDFNKLSPADQQAVLAKQGNNPNYAAIAMKRYYDANK